MEKQRKELVKYQGRKDGTPETGNVGTFPAKNKASPANTGIGAGVATLAAASIGIATGTLPLALAAALPFATGAMVPLIGKHLILPVNKKTKPVSIVSETWKTRPKANLVKWLMQSSDTSLDTVASYLDCTVNYLNNKLTRDSFSFDDLILIAYACGYTFVLTDNNEEIQSENSFRVDLLDYFGNSDPAKLERISRIEDEKQNAIREEYEKKKAELERMKAEYGFED